MKPETTKSRQYTKYLVGSWAQSLKRVINVQFPYQYKLLSLSPGKTLEVGCGIGRNLKVLSRDSLGIDHNLYSIKVASELGFNAVSTSMFDLSSHQYKKFDTLLFSHVLEHVTISEAENLISKYAIFLKKHGKIIVICPQEKGYKSDKTHVSFLDYQSLKSILINSGFRVDRQFSYPLPRFFGRLFTYNEFYIIGTSDRLK